jgi:5'-nucleotidase
MNGGSIRADALISAGRLTKRDLLEIIPFKNKVVKLELTGAVLRALLEHGVARSGEDSQPGRFPQVSGIRFTFDAGRPPGSRVTSVTVNGVPLDDKRTYSLATSNFLAEGGDGYEMLKGARVLTAAAQAPSDYDVVRGAMAGRPIAPKVDGRIKRLDNAHGATVECPE